MSGASLEPLGGAVPALVHGARAARVEDAAPRRVHRARDLAFQDLVGARRLDRRVGDRDGREVTPIGGKRVAAAGVRVFNPAFDVTPAALVSAIITEHGVVRGDFERGLARAVGKAEKLRRGSAA